MKLLSLNTIQKFNFKLVLALVLHQNEVNVILLLKVRHFIFKIFFFTVQLLNSTICYSKRSSKMIYNIGVDNHKMKTQYQYENLLSKELKWVKFPLQKYFSADAPSASPLSFVLMKS